MSTLTQSGLYLILGATGSVGSQVARAIIESEPTSRLVLHGRSRDAVEKLRHELGDARVMATFVADAQIPTQLEHELDRCLQGEEIAKLDGAVNAIGSFLLKPITRTSLDEFQETLNVNLVSSFLLIKAASVKMGRTGGSIVVISSAAASTGMASHEAIAAAKAGIEGLVRSSATSVARTGIRVNAVAPGLVETPLTAAITSDPASLKASIAMHALKRVGQPEEIAQLIIYLLGSESSWITGSTFAIDGGLASLRPRPSQ